MPKRTSFKAVPERVRNRVPPAPEGTPPQERQTGPGPPSAAPTEVEDTPRSNHTIHSTFTVHSYRHVSE